MSALFRWFALRSLARHPGRAALTVLGVALGVGVFTSVRLASRAALDSFSDSVDAVTGRAELVVRGDGEGFDERVFGAVAGAPGARAASPVVEVEALAAPRGGASESDFREPLVVLGVDPLLAAPFARADRGAPSPPDDAFATAFAPDGIALTRAFARRHGLATGDTLALLVSGAPGRFAVTRVLDAEDLQRAWGGNVAIVDLATAQERFGRLGRLDRIELIARAGERERLRAALDARLPPGLRVESPAARTRQVENMVNAFRLNLTALGFIALFVATFLVYDAVSGAALRRRREAAILRALGATRGAVRALFLAEGAFYGVAGGALGLGVGVLLSRFAVRGVGRTLEDLYRVRGGDALAPDPGVLAGGFALGIGLALAAAWLPSEEASRARPALAAREGVRPPLSPRALRISTAAGVLALALAALAAWTATFAHRPYDGFASAFFALGGFALLVPAGTLAIERALRAPVRALAGPAGLLASRSLEDSAGRTAPVVAALLVAVAMVVAMSVMVSSFRRTVDVWVRQSIRGDLYVEPAGGRVNGGAARLPAAFVAAAGRIAGVEAVDSFRGTRVVFGGRPALVAGVEFAVQRDRGRLLFRRGRSAEVVQRALSEGGAIVSESFARHHRLAEGDTLRLPAAAGIVPLAIAGVFYDYSTDAGVVFLDRARWAGLFDDDRTQSLALYLAPGADLARAQEAVRRESAGLWLHVTPNAELRARVLTVFDRTFQVTWGLQAIAVLVAVLGVLNSLTALVLERASELAMLRAAGAVRAQIVRIVLAESALLGAVAAVLGALCGAVLALVLIHVINLQFFGWTIRTVWDPRVFAGAIAVVLVAALAAGFAPARLAAASEPAAGLREE